MTGRCQICPYRWHLRKDGTLQAHNLWSGSNARWQCAGSGLKPAEGTIR